MGHCDAGDGGSAMAEQPGFFDGDERLKALSAAGIRWNGWPKSISKCFAAI
jgi:hypothetical protein